MSPIETAEALAELHRVAFTNGERPWTTPEFASLLSTPGVAIFLRDRGFLALRTAADEAEIITLAVHPAARRQGLARVLVAEALDTARSGGVRRILLEVAVDNDAARALYAQAGFVETGRRRGYYARSGGERVDALVLVRPV